MSSTLSDVWNDSVSASASVAIWRMPASDKIHFLVDMSGKVRRGAVDVEKSPFGFAVSPFINANRTETLFLNADIYHTFLASDLSGECCLRGYAGMSAGASDDGSFDHFLKMANVAISAIAEGAFDKVVPVAAVKAELPEDLGVIELFSRISDAHPGAFVSLVAIPEVGTWIGASPELLVECSSSFFRTVALAATQPYVEGVSLSDVTWNQKEIEEQAMVSRYIIEQFKSIRLREFVESGPQTIRAGSMLHLKSEFAVDLNRVTYPNLGTVMLDLLHPTSAVCGMPKPEALKFIAKGIDRELYTGYLGPVNMDGVTSLYVNLRCMRVFQKHAVVYAGAGITHNSIAEKERDEVVMKCRSLLDAVGI